MAWEDGCRPTDRPLMNTAIDRHIRKSDPLPYYAQLAAILRDQIRTGDLSPGDLLPSEGELGTMYDISRTAVRQALDELVAESLVHKEKGRGSFVSAPKVNEFVLQDLRGFFQEMTRRGADVETEVLGAGVAPVQPDAVADLGLDSGANVIWMERLRRVNGLEVVLTRTHLPLPRFDGLLDHDLMRESLYDILATDYGVIAGQGRRRFEAVAATAEQAAHLGVEAGAPLLKLTAVNHDQNQQPFEYFTAHYRSDRAAFDVVVDQSGGPSTAVMDLKDPV